LTVFEVAPVAVIPERIVAGMIEPLSGIDTTPYTSSVIEELAGTVKEPENV
jgi:hypothetical protein